MIYVVLMGRLGNQMFEYATAIALAKKCEQKICLIDIFENNLLYEFKISEIVTECSYLKKRVIYQIVKKHEKRFKIHCKKNKVLEKNIIWERYRWEKKYLERNANKGYIMFQNGYIDIPCIKKKNIILYGFFQSAKYFQKQDVHNSICLAKERKEFLKFIDILKERRVTCIHIRRGDYVNNKIFGVCTEKYYQSAINMILHKDKEAVFCVFSDEPTEAIKMVDFYDNEVLMIPENFSPSENVIAMEYCTNFILSNSSFSWWGQFLGRKEESLIIAPSKWNNADGPFEDIYMDNWVRLPV